MLKARVNGNECILFYEERIPQEKAPIGYPYMYHLRHDEDDWTRPISIERFVLVNFFGTMFVKNKIEFGTEHYIDVKRIKYERKLVKIRLRKSILNSLWGL